MRDDEGRRLLEAYLDRILGPDWRERAEAEAEREHSAAGGTGQGWGRKSKSAGRTPMTREEAYEILGPLARRRYGGDQGGAPHPDA